MSNRRKIKSKAKYRRARRKKLRLDGVKAVIGWLCERLGGATVDRTANNALELQCLQDEDTNAIRSGRAMIEALNRMGY